MILVVDPGSAVPVYEQIREQVTLMVGAGTLLAETRLPTIRQLAADLGLSKGTVARAYEMLEADNVIATRGRRGSFVLELGAISPAATADGLSEAAKTFAVRARQLGVDVNVALDAMQTAWSDIDTTINHV